MRTSSSELERLALDQLEPQLMRRGYRLIRRPTKADLPSFIEGYIPDAIAVGQSPNIAVEIKSSGNPKIERNLAHLRKLFEGRNDWSLQVYYFDSLIPVVAALPSDKLDNIVETVANLSNQNSQAAFLLAWSLLEASARGSGLVEDKPLGANRIVSVLASEGILNREMFPELLELAELRNKLSHGQLDIEPSKADIERLLDVIAMIRAPEEHDLN